MQELVRQQRSIEQDAANTWRTKFGAPASAKRGALLRTDSAYERCEPMERAAVIKPVAFLLSCEHIMQATPVLQRIER